MLRPLLLSPVLLSFFLLFALAASAQDAAAAEEVTGVVEHGTKMVTLTNPTVSPSTATASIDFSTLSLSNNTNVNATQFTLSDGSTVVFKTGTGSTPPAFYNTSGNYEIRVYANNTITFTCQQAIATIVMTTETTSYEGSSDSIQTVVFRDEGTTAEFCNVKNNSNTQLRVCAITVTYAGAAIDDDDEGDDDEGDDDEGDDDEGDDDEGGDDEGGEGAVITGVVDRGDGLVTLINPTVSPGAATASIAFSDYSFTNGKSVNDTIFTLSDGSTVVFSKASGDTAPAWYDEGAAIHVYYNNTITFTCQQPIAKIEMTTNRETYQGSANATVVFSSEGMTSEYCNVRSSSNTQLRLSAITITYAGDSVAATTGTFTISSVGYATYYSPFAYTMPAGVTGTTVSAFSSSTSVVILPWEYAAGSTVPAATALILCGEEGTYEYSCTTAPSSAEENMLLGSSVATTTYGPDDSTDYVYYELSTGSYGVGFYYGATDGAAFPSEATKAWLPVAADVVRNLRFLALADSGTTGLAALAAPPAAGDVYTLQGVRVSDMSKKGIYLVAGRKVIVR